MVEFGVDLDVMNQHCAKVTFAERLHAVMARQWYDGIVLVAVLHPEGYPQIDSDLSDLAADIDLFLKIVITAVTRHNGLWYRSFSSAIAGGFSGPFMAMPENASAMSAFSAITQIVKEIATQNVQRAAQSKKALNAGFGIVLGKMLGGMRGFNEFASYELVGGSVYLANALAYLAQQGQCFANAEFIAHLPNQEKPYSQRKIALANGVTQMIYVITE